EQTIITADRVGAGDRDRIDSAAEQLNAEAAAVLDILTATEGVRESDLHHNRVAYDGEAIRRLARLIVDVKHTVGDFARRPALRMPVESAEDFVVARTNTSSFDEAL